jgi:hypothetical protein
MEKEFEVYIAKIVKRLDCNEREREEVAEEIQDHLTLLKREFLEKGISENDAVKLAISTFGNEKRISRELQHEMSPYLKFIRLFAVVICSALTVLMIHKGITLWNMGSSVDGQGIGIYFLSFEINDRVPEQSIPSYAIGFFVASIITALVPISLVAKKVLAYR